MAEKILFIDEDPLEFLRDFRRVPFLRRVQRRLSRIKVLLLIGVLGGGMLAGAIALLLHVVGGG